MGEIKLLSKFYYTVKPMYFSYFL